MDDTIVLEGTVEDIIFQNKENWYTVFNFNSDDGDEVTCVGTIPQLSKGESLKLSGTMVIHPSYGLQLKVDIFERSCRQMPPQ